MSKTNIPRGDKPDWASYVPIAILAITTLIMVAAFFFGGQLLGDAGSEGVEAFLARFRASPFAPLVVVLVFIGLGLTGFPQFLLIGATVAIFGAWGGFFYSWAATILSASVGFGIGRFSGGSVLRRWGGNTINKASEIIGRHGVAATVVVRLIPSGPFIVVNIVAGMSHIKYWQFALGTALGIIPKTALIAFVGGRLLDFVQSQNPWHLTVVAVVLIAWALAGYWVRQRYFAAVSKSEPAERASEAPETSQSHT